MPNLADANSTLKGPELFTCGAGSAPQPSTGSPGSSESGSSSAGSSQQSQQPSTGATEAASTTFGSNDTAPAATSAAPVVPSASEEAECQVEYVYV